jgi:hypothetical protein
MFKKRFLPKIRTYSSLWWIGTWANVWWAVSCFYVVVLFWNAKDYIVAAIPNAVAENMLRDWSIALNHTFYTTTWLQIMLVTILSVWIAGGIIWMQDLKHRRISYRAAFKDLFLVIHK